MTTSNPTVKVMWNGGVDWYGIVPGSVREMTPKELATENAGNNIYFPTFIVEEPGVYQEWLKGKFLDSPVNQAILAITPTQCVLCGHVTGGD